MHTLTRKLWREMRLLKGQSIAIALLVSIAMTIYVGSTNTHLALTKTLSTYYEQYRFAHVFASVVRAPRTVTEQLSAVEGVVDVEARVVTSASIDWVPNSADGTSQLERAEPMTAEIISIPDVGPPRINCLHLRSGRVPSPGARDEVITSEGFANAHQLAPGARLRAVINGRRETLTIVGVALSPEFIYEIRPGDLMPDDKHFTVLWMPETALAAALDMSGAFNDVVAILAHGAVEEQVLQAFDRVLARYGGTGAYGRDRQVSHRFITDEIRQQQGTAVFAPMVFLGVSAFLVSVVFSRLIVTQRQIIGMLKALGYSNWAIGLHFASFAAAIVVAGAALGALGGQVLGVFMARMYAGFYRFPILLYAGGVVVVLKGALQSLVLALVGISGAVRKAVRLAPAEAMRAPRPASYRQTWVEHVVPMRLLSQTGRMVARDIGRRPSRWALSSVGIASAVAMVVAALFFRDSMDYLTDVTLGSAQHEHATVAFASRVGRPAVHNLTAMRGVLAAEPFQASAATLRGPSGSYRLAIMGLDPSPKLHPVADSKGRPVSLPERGLVLTDELARRIGVAPGGRVWVDFETGRRLRREAIVVDTIDELIGVSAYTMSTYLDELTGEPPTLAGAFLAVDAVHEQTVYRELLRMPKVAGVTLRSAAVASFRDTSAQYIGVFAAILTAFAGMIAIGVVYNTARVSFAERERELATLRVLGLYQGEAWFVLIGELASQLVVALPMGCLFGWLLAKGLALAMNSDLYRLPVVVTPSSYALSMGLVVLAAGAVVFRVSRWVGNLDLLEVLKARE